MIGERKWWPAEWVDEVVPPGRASPSDFIIDADGHYFLGYRLDADDVTEFQKRFYNTGIDPADTIEFMWADDLGPVDVAILPDGDFGHVDVPSEATHFWTDRDGNTLAHSLEDFVKQWIEAHGKPDKPQVVTVAMACWSEGIPHQFAPAIEGVIGPTFTSLKVEEGATVQ